MIFEKNDIEEFKANDYYAWMGTRIITPECISFTDYMFGGLWTITKELDDSDEIYVLSRKKKGGKRLVRITDDITVSSVLLTTELMLWGESAESTPDLSHIPLSYILRTPERLALGDASLAFLIEIIPKKLAQEGIEF